LLTERARQQELVAQAAVARVLAEPSVAALHTLFDPQIGVSPAALRQTILALAVQGKLVPQDAADEPAQVSSNKVTINSHSPVKVSYIDQLPMNWILTYLGNIAEWGSGSTPSRGMHQYYGGNVVWLKSGELNAFTKCT
jgi:type I restriction enzyme S subunit